MGVGHLRTTYGFTLQTWVHWLHFQSRGLPAGVCALPCSNSSWVPNRKHVYSGFPLDLSLYRKSLGVCLNWANGPQVTKPPLVSNQNHALVDSTAGHTKEEGRGRRRPAPGCSLLYPASMFSPKNKFSLDGLKGHQFHYCQLCLFFPAGEEAIPDARLLQVVCLGIKPD